MSTKSSKATYRVVKDKLGVFGYFLWVLFWLWQFAMLIHFATNVGSSGGVTLSSLLGIGFTVSLWWAVSVTLQLFIISTKRFKVIVDEPTLVDREVVSYEERQAMHQKEKILKEKKKSEGGRTQAQQKDKEPDGSKIKQEYSDGRIVEVTYVDGKRHGEMTITYPDGRIEKRQYVDGEEQPHK